ncbi:MAG: carboxypeptidase regulatory-like domain-containing protein, partial [Gemmatimonadales bacterium]
MGGFGLAAGLLAIAITPIDLRGQGIRGRVVDSTTGLVVPDANVRLIANDGRVVGATRSDDQGLYRLVARDEGWYQVEIRRVGYRPLLAGPFRLRDRAELGLELRLVAVAVELDPVEVTEEAAPLHNPALAQVGFYDRQRSDFGRFITRDEIDRRQARQFTELLGMVPGVRLVPGVGGPGRSGVQLRGSRLSDGGLCRPRVYIDGLMMLRGDAGPRRLQRESPANPLATELAADGV